METAGRLMNAMKTFIAPDEPKTVSILLVGETGAGKSTFINYLANFFLRGRLEDLKVVIPTRTKRMNVRGFESHAEGNLDDQTKSMTTKCTEYRFQRGSTTYVFIDTPGLSDTSGVEADSRNINEILEAACRQKAINAVAFVINGSVPRITVNMKTTMTRIMGNYPNSFSENLLVILTNCPGDFSNFSIKKLPNQPRKVFRVNNMAFMDDLEDAEPASLQESWNRSMNTIKGFVEFVSELSAISTREFVELKELRGEIKAEIYFGVEKIKDLEKQMNALEETKRAKQKADRLAADALREEEELKQKVQNTQRDVAEKEARLRSSEESSRSVSENMRGCMNQMLDITSKMNSLTNSLEQHRRSKLTWDQCSYDDVTYVIEPIKTSYHNTNCKHDQCLEPCHEMCGLEFISTQGDVKFSDCAAMQANGYCHCGHLPVDHFHAHYKKNRVAHTVKKMRQDLLDQMARQQAEIDREEMEIKRLGNVLNQLGSQTSDYQASLRRLQESGKISHDDVARAAEMKRKVEAERAKMEQNVAAYNAQRSAIKRQEETIDEDIRNCRGRLTSMKTKLCGLCENMKKVCRYFNFVDELQCELKALRANQKTLTDTQSAQEAETFINHLQELINRLTER